MRRGRTRVASPTRRRSKSPTRRSVKAPALPPRRRRRASKSPTRHKPFDARLLPPPPKSLSSSTAASSTRRRSKSPTRSRTSRPGWSSKRRTGRRGKAGPGSVRSKASRASTKHRSSSKPRPRRSGSRSRDDNPSAPAVSHRDPDPDSDTFVSGSTWSSDGSDSDRGDSEGEDGDDIDHHPSDVMSLIEEAAEKEGGKDGAANYLTSKTLLASSPAYGLHRILMTAVESAAVQETLRMGTAGRSTDEIATSPTRSRRGSSSSRSDGVQRRLAAGHLLASQIGTKVSSLEEQLVALVSKPHPGVDDLSTNGLCAWAPEGVAAKAMATIAGLDASDRSTLDRLAANWREQLALEEAFILGLYHHLTHTFHMLWDRVLTLLDDVEADVTRTRAKLMDRLDHLVATRSGELTPRSGRGGGAHVSGGVGGGDPDMHSKHAGIVSYNSYCVTNGLPLFEDASSRSFDEFCAHWKENHRILVQRRMLWQASKQAKADRAAQLRRQEEAEERKAPLPDLPPEASPEPDAAFPVSSAHSCMAEEEAAKSVADAESFTEHHHHHRGLAGVPAPPAQAGPSDGSTVSSSSDGGGPGAAETEHIRLLKLVRDTHVWKDGRRYCEVRAAMAWKETLDVIVERVGDKVAKCREHEQGLEVGRFKHLDKEFQTRIQSLRLEEFVLKERLRQRATTDPNLARTCVALRRQRKPIRQHAHRVVLLRHIKAIRPVAEQVLARLQPAMHDTEHGGSGGGGGLAGGGAGRPVY